METEQNKKVTKLEALFQERKEIVAKMVIEADGKISDEDIDALNRLDQLIALYDKRGSSHGRQWWPIALALGFTLLIISFLLFFRVSNTQVELDLALTDVRFDVSNQQVLFDVMQLASLGVTGVQEIQLPRTTTSTERTVHASEPEGLNVRLEVASHKGRTGTLTLSAFVLPEKAQVQFDLLEPLNSFRLSVVSNRLEFRVEVNGPITFFWSDRPPEQVNFTSPTSVFIKLGDTGTDITLALARIIPLLSQQLMIENLSVIHVRQLVEPDRTLASHVSGIVSGTLYLESLNGKARSLRMREALRLEKSNGEIRVIQLESNYFKLNFYGKVQGLSTGADDHARSLMPTYLEYLQANHSASLFWSAAIYLFGLIIAALRWWGVTV